MKKRRRVEDFFTRNLKENHEKFKKYCRKEKFLFNVFLLSHNFKRKIFLKIENRLFIFFFANHS